MLRKLQLVDETSLKAIRCAVRQVIRRGWFRKDEFKDLVQDVVVELLQKLDGFDPSRSSWSTYCTLIARNYLARRAKRQGDRPQVDSLQDPVDRDDETPAEDAIEDRHGTGRCGCQMRTEREWVEFRRDLQDLVDRLSDPLREFCESYLKYPNYSHVATSLEISRFTVYRRRDVIRQCVARDSLHEYRF